MHTLRVNDECPCVHTNSEPILFLACLYFTFKYSQVSLLSELLAEVHCYYFGQGWGHDISIGRVMQKDPVE